MKTLTLLAALLATVSGLRAEETAPTNQPPAALAADANSDEIDLEELDDSAEAAKAPAVKSLAAAGEAVTLVDIACDNATLADVLRQFRKVTDANIISDDSTNLLRRVSVNLHRVPWLEGLQSILNSRNYRLEQRGEIYFVKEDKVLEPVLTRTFSLNHASAKELADLFNKNYGKKDAKGNTIPVASCFEGANVVVVNATEKIIGNCETIIKAVDKAVAQIYIEARFLELSSAALHKLGIDWSSLDSWKVSATGMKGGWESSYGRLNDFGTKAAYTQKKMVKTGETISSGATSSSRSETYTDLADGASAISSSVLSPGAIGEAAGAGISAASMAWNQAGGFSGQLNAQDFALALSAFESLGEGKIFSNPKVIVSNGKEAVVDMTTKFPNVDVTSQRNTSTTTPYTDISTRIQVIPGDKETGMFAGDIFYSWGITLSVRPRISPDGLISVVITPTISQLDSTPGISDDGFYKVGNSAGSGDSANTSVYYSKYPVIDMKRITTEFTMKDGSTAVIGGLSRTTEEDKDTGIPYLCKLPWIGQKLFGWKGRQKVQREIIVCVTIGIAEPADLPKDIGLPLNAVISREYVKGSRLEPGLRPGNADTVLAVDTDDLTDQHKKRAATGSGTVTITPTR